MDDELVKGTKKDMEKGCLGRAFTGEEDTFQFFLVRLRRGAEREPSKK